MKLYLIIICLFCSSLLFSQNIKTNFTLDADDILLTDLALEEKDSEDIYYYTSMNMLYPGLGSAMQGDPLGLPIIIAVTILNYFNISEIMSGIAGMGGTGYAIITIPLSLVLTGFSWSMPELYKNGYKNYIKSNTITP